MQRMTHGLALAGFVVLIASCDSLAPSQAPKSNAPPANTAKTVFWGDTHLHSANSADAFAFGTRLSAEDAFRFARGEKVTSASGLTAQLKRPLDFLVVADHAEGLGLSAEILNGNPKLMADPIVVSWSALMNEGGKSASLAARQIIDAHSAGRMPNVMTDRNIVGPIFKSVWQSHGVLADRVNDPGTFTAFIGYEYTALDIGDNLHRVVMFRDGSDKTGQIMPFSSNISKNPKDLWAALATYEQKTGGQVLAIPHNSNLSNGKMFPLAQFEGAAIDTEYAAKSARWEPLVEITQIKGDSESHPFLSPHDEFAGFGDAGWSLGNLNMSRLKTNDMLAGEYVREALKRGLALEAQTGVNPYKFGVIGSTDSHTALSTGDEDNYFGKHANDEPGPGRAAHQQTPKQEQSRVGWHYLAGGYAAVWADSNTREDIFDAMMRKEVYGTTGPRMTVRLFAGGDFKPGDEALKGFEQRGYAKGVPMGGDLPANGSSPAFIIAATKDPIGAHLDRIQIIKGWRDSSGDLHEKVYNVAWSEGRQPDESGNLPPVGDTVDLSIPTWTDTIGAPELRAYWRDPDFDPAQSAFYYARVIEIPTPRWVAYDAVRFSAKIPGDALMKSQERAYTSPVWYSPNK